VLLQFFTPASTIHLKQQPKGLPLPGVPFSKWKSFSGLHSLALQKNIKLKVTQIHHAFPDSRL